MYFIPTNVTPVKFKARSADGTVVELELEIRDFLLHFLNGSSVFNTTGRGIKASIRIEQAIRDSFGDEKASPPKLGSAYVAIDDPDRVMLLDAMQNPQPMPETPAYPLSPARLLDGMIEAVVTAPQVRPGAAVLPVADEAPTDAPKKNGKPSRAAARA